MIGQIGASSHENRNEMDVASGEGEGEVCFFTRKIGVEYVIILRKGGGPVDGDAERHFFVMVDVSAALQQHLHDGNAAASAGKGSNSFGVAWSVMRDWWVHLARARTNILMI